MAVVAAVVVAVVLYSPTIASDEHLGGVWTKTTHPDPKNIVIFFMDAHIVKAIGYGMIAERPALWYAEGSVQDRHAKLYYRYSSDTTPNGWEPEGVMQLKLSEDGNSMIGRATSRSGTWSDRIEFKKIILNSN
jgi:hypothetical protein